MRRPAVDRLVYTYLFPRPQPNDPQNFHEFLERYLVIEVRQEVHSFYGHLDTQEAKYPGLDYSHPTHRTRLSRWPWHRRLFRAFNYLGLTPCEIGNLTKWEGTKWAKERFEKEQNITILDTAADGMPDHRASRSPPTMQLHSRDGPVNSSPRWQANCERPQAPRGNSTTPRLARLPSRPALPGHMPNRIGRSGPMSSMSSMQPQLRRTAQRTIHVPSPSSILPAMRGRQILMEGPIADSSMTQDESDDNVDSGDSTINVHLGEQLREHAVSPEIGGHLTSLDIGSEEWYKTAMESAGTGAMGQQILTIPELHFMHSSFSAEFPELQPQPQPPQPQSQTESVSSSSEPDYISAHILEAARLGNWDEVPHFLHNVLHTANEMTDGN